MNEKTEVANVSTFHSRELNGKKKKCILIAYTSKS